MSLADDARIEAELLRERVKAGRLENPPRGVEPTGIARTLSPCQERALLYKHTTGEFPGQFWATIEVLFKQGMIAEEISQYHGSKVIVVTAKGKKYCDEHHLEM